MGNSLTQSKATFVVALHLLVLPLLMASWGRGAEEVLPLKYVYETVEIPKLASMIGKEVVSPAMEKAGLRIRVLDLKMARSQAPLTLLKGNGLYLWMEGTMGDARFGNYAEVIDANGDSLLESPHASLAAPVEQGGNIVSYPLPRPLDDSMTLRLKILPDAQVWAVRIPAFLKLEDKFIDSPLLEAIGLTVKVADIEASVMGSSNVIVRMEGPAELLRFVAPPIVVMPSGRPWAICETTDELSPTVREVKLFVAPDSTHAAEMQIGMVLPAGIKVPGMAPLTFEAHPQTRPAAPTVAKKPSPAPSKQEIDGLIAQLGGDDRDARDRAEDKLWKIGAPALAALKEASTDPSPELQRRAGRLVEAMERPPLPPMTWGNRIGTKFWNSEHTAIYRGIEGFCEFMILEDGDGIRMNAHGLVDGVDRAQNVFAATPDALHRYAPDFYKLYRIANPIPSLQLSKPSKPSKAGKNSGVAYPEFARELKDAMRAAKLTPEQFRQVLDQLDKVGVAGSDSFHAWMEKMPDEKLQQIFLAEADKLRQMLQDLKLPVNIDGIAAAPRARLGIKYVTPPTPPDGSAPESGAYIGCVAPGNRGAAVGLKRGDIVKMINNRQVNNAADLSEVMRTEPAEITLDILRDGTPLHLKEK
jgi:hypothetical protein